MTDNLAKGFKQISIPVKQKEIDFENDLIKQLQLLTNQFTPKSTEEFQINILDFFGNNK